MTPDTVIILTTYNRKTLVQDAIRSVLEQDCDRARLIILDDGSNEETRNAIQQACGDPQWIVESIVASGKTLSVPYIGEHIGKNITWWQGPDRSMAERRASIPYSVTINIALNHLLRLTDKYVCYVVDDDFLYPESIRTRAEFLDKNQDAHVVYGRTRSVEYDTQGFNKWAEAARPESGMYFPRPTGKRQSEPGVGGKRCYFQEGDNHRADPQTGLAYVDEGYWEPGWLDYGKPHRVDHNQAMHRVECLKTCRYWPLLSGNEFPPRQGCEFWGEDVSHGVGDASFFDRLATVHQFYGIDAWVCSKRFHSKSWGTPDNEIRE